jgi:hypothetical protein
MAWELRPSIAGTAAASLMVVYCNIENFFRRLAMSLLHRSCAMQIGRT